MGKKVWSAVLLQVRIDRKCAFCGCFFYLSFFPCSDTSPSVHALDRPVFPFILFGFLN